MSWLAGVPEARRRRYLILISIIVLAGLCYCAAFAALLMAPSNQALQPTATATTVRVKDGKTVTTHGPFAETK